MARVLIAWELGEAFGHLVRCQLLAHGLRQRGHEVVLALKEVRMPAGSLTIPGVTILPAPQTSQRLSKGRPPVNYAELLQHCGFAQAEDVVARLVAWQGIYSLARPDVVVVDHAPTALLGAQLAGIAHVAIGNGFVIPPDVTPWPSIRPWEDIPEEALILAEQRLDNVTAAAQRALGYASPLCMRALFGEHIVLDTFSEIDHYGSRLSARYAGPIVSLPSARRVTWQDQSRDKILAYLRPDVPGFKTVISALATCGAEVFCVAPGLSPNMARQLATRSLRISLAPVELPPLLAHADLAIGYGSSGFVAQTLLAGVPVLMCPKHVEQALMARRVEAMGAGKMLDARASVNSVVNDLRSTLQNPDCRHIAQTFSARYQDFSTDQAVERTLDVIEQRLAHGRVVPLPGHTHKPSIPPVCLH